ncbi:MAG: hypothetical protein HQK83_14455 [Fibrobacteria bacterium]|nr:hypothetical protein [Fibrobacteria bacterium]
MSISKTKLAGWLPAVILPTATTLQLIRVMQSSGGNVSALSWFLFGLANVGAYLFTEKYFSIQALLSFALTAVLDFVIVGLVLTT